MGMDAAGGMELCVSSDGLLLWLPGERLVRILSGYALKAAVQAEEDAEGAAVLDGRPVRVCSLRALLGLPAGEERHALLLAQGDELTGLLVDEVLESTGGALGAAVELPRAVLWEANSFLKGAVYLEARDSLAYVVDLERLLAAAER